MNEEDDFNEEEYLRHLREQVEEIRSRHKDDVCPHGRRNGELCVECGPFWVCNYPVFPPAPVKPAILGVGWFNVLNPSAVSAVNKLAELNEKAMRKYENEMRVYNAECERIRNEWFAEARGFHEDSRIH